MMRIIGCRPVIWSAIFTVATTTSAMKAVAEADSAAEEPHEILQEITVTAQRKQENLQTVPVAVSVVQPDQLTTQGVRSASDLTTVVPGLKFQVTNGVSRDEVSFALRGQAVSQGTNAPAVIPYFAEVPLLALTDGQFYDISAIQVLRGPQGTLFGRVTDGGAILFSPTKPGNEFEGYAQAQLGNYNLRQFEGAVTTPFGERVSLRLAGTVVRRDGFTQNILTGRDLDNLSTESGRASLIVKVTDSLENYTIVNFNHADNNGSGFVLNSINLNDAVPTFPCCTAAAMQAALAQQQALGPRRVSLGEPGVPGFDQNEGSGFFQKRQTWWAINTTTWTVSDDLKVKNIFGFQRNEQKRGGTVGIVGFQISPYLPNANQKLFTDELQAQGRAFDGRLDYTGGLYYENSRPAGPAVFSSAWVYNGAIVQSGTNDQFTRSRAAYAQLGYKLTDSLKLNLGVRRTKDDVTAHQATYNGIGAFGADLTRLPFGQCLPANATLPLGVVVAVPCTTQSAAFAVTTYTLGLDYQITHDVFAYATYRKGYRPGGVNAAAFNQVVPPYGPETNKNHEVGIKATYGTEVAAFRSNLAVFYDKFSNNQQTVLVFPNGDPTNAISSIINAPSATIEGVELDQTARFFEALTLNASYAYLNAGFDRSKFGYTPAQLAAACPADPLTTPADPTKLCPTTPFPFAAKHTLQGGIDYELPTIAAGVGKVNVGADAYFTTETFTTGAAAQFGTVPKYTIYNAHLSWTNAMSQPLDFTFFVNNLTDKLYASAAGYNGLSAGSFGTFGYYYGPPRMWGLSAKYTF